MLDDFHNTVLEFMRDYGTTAKLIKEVVGEYDPSLGDSPVTVTEIDVQAILMDLTLQSNGLSTKYQKLVEAGDKEAYIRPNKDTPFTIGPEDRLRVGGVEYKVVTMKEINPTTTDVVLFTLYLRR